MNIRELLKSNLQTANMICSTYLEDLSDEEAMRRPHPDCNHINWQIGHIISSENMMANGCVSGSVPELPAGFNEQYAKDKSSSDDASAFVPKTELLALAKQQTEAIQKMIDGMSDEDFDAPGPEQMKAYAPTKGNLIGMIASHWMMHAGQWVVVRRQLGREIAI